jgi:hypothetical protein
VACFYFGDEGFARLKSFCEIDLPHPTGLTARLETFGKLEAQFDEESFFAGQPQQFLGASELPSCGSSFSRLITRMGVLRKLYSAQHVS